MKNRRLLDMIAAGLFLAAGIAAAAADAASVKVKVTAELANIRLKPSIGSVIIRQIPQGEILEATKKEGEWYLVKLEPDETGATSGYVHESLVLPLESLPPAEVKPKIIEKPPDKPVEKPPVQKPEPKPKEEPVIKPPVKTEGGGETGAERGRVFVSLYAGLGYALIGDLNKGAQGLADLYSAQLGVAASDDVTLIHSGLLFGGEVGIPLAAGVYLTVGAERLAKGAESVLSFARTGGAGADVYTAFPQFAAFPLRAAIAMYPADFLYLKLGASYTFASCDYYYKFEHDKAWQEWIGEAKAGGLGLLGGIGVDWRFGGNFALFGEITGHYAPISGFEGTGTFQDSTLSVPVTEEGKLYAYEAKTSGQTRYALLYIRNKVPSEAGVENAREAKIDFSGVALRAGLRIRF